MMKWWPYIRKFLIAALIALVIIQFISIDKTNPPVDASQDFASLTNPPSAILEDLKSACYDCHSHETTYPWYTNIQPVAWWVKGHIKGGVKHLNFSIWDSYSDKKKAHKIEECIEEIEERHMPLKSYTWTHADAKLDDTQRQELIQWFKTL
jgi:hypothetical protein